MAEGTDLGALYVPIEADLRGWTEQLHQAEGAAESSANTVATVMSAGFSVPADALNSLMLLRTLLHTIGGRAGQIGMVATRLGFLARSARMLGAGGLMGGGLVAGMAAVLGVVSWLDRKGKEAIERSHEQAAAFNDVLNQLDKQIAAGNDVEKELSRELALIQATTEARRDALKTTYEQKDADDKRRAALEAPVETLRTMRTEALAKDQPRLVQQLDEQINTRLERNAATISGFMRLQTEQLMALGDTERKRVERLEQGVGVLRVQLEQGDNAGDLALLQAGREERLNEIRSKGGLYIDRELAATKEMFDLRGRLATRDRGIQLFQQVEGQMSFAALSRLSMIQQGAAPELQKQMLGELQQIRRAVAPGLRAEAG